MIYLILFAAAVFLANLLVDAIKGLCVLTVAVLEIALAIAIVAARYSVETYQQARYDFCQEYIAYYRDCPQVEVQGANGTPKVTENPSSRKTSTQTTISIPALPPTTQVPDISLERIYRSSVANKQQAIVRSLSDLNQEYYELAFKQCLPVLQEDWQNLSVRKLQKICTQVNNVQPGSISGHYSRKTNKRLLVSKLKQVYC